MLADVDLELEPGELLAIAGPNGAGKSTLLRLLAGDRAPTDRDGRARRLAPRRHAATRARTPACGDAAAHVDRLRLHRPAGGRDGLPSAARLRTTGSSDVVGEALARTGIPHLADRSFRTLSGGEQALATFARVLAQCTPVLLLDEPTASLDLTTRSG